jgi:hypothetical protein
MKAKRAMLRWLRGLRSSRTTSLQHKTCMRFGAKCAPVAPGSKAGVALQTQGQLPLNGLRHPPEGDTCGWYLWWGDELDQTNDHFFQPLHVEHLDEYCPEAIPYLWLPPGWRIQVAPGHEDVWFEEKLLDLSS